MAGVTGRFAKENEKHEFTSHENNDNLGQYTPKYDTVLGLRESEVDSNKVPAISSLSLLKCKSTFDIIKHQNHCSHCRFQQPSISELQNSTSFSANICRHHFADIKPTIHSIPIRSDLLRYSWKYSCSCNRFNQKCQKIVRPSIATDAYLRQFENKLYKLQTFISTPNLADETDKRCIIEYDPQSQLGNTDFTDTSRPDVIKLNACQAPSKIATQKRQTICVRKCHQQPDLKPLSIVEAKQSPSSVLSTKF